GLSRPELKFAAGAALILRLQEEVARVAEVFAELDRVIGLLLGENRRELDGTFRSIPRKAGGKTDERAGPSARVDVDARHAARPRVDVRAADAQLLCGQQSVAARHGGVVEIAHAAARFHDERAAPHTRVID